MNWCRFTLTTLVAGMLLAASAASAQRRQAPPPDPLSDESLDQLADLAAEAVAKASANSFVFADPIYQQAADKLDVCQSGVAAPSRAALEQIAARAARLADAGKRKTVFAKQPVDATQRMCYFAVIVKAFGL
jgi:L-aminopeptidase/D-esterase-like protein